ncbi:MSH2-Ex5 isoform [Salpingoeca rosetta]|uniref:DNA mismatch repair protein MSH2 n=1 Tax=Salpingoeca rosetta (strain ATCC 50818 / BSB-021) TaxID=946362 RepID=F2UMP4_SALR5|nr:MSH2-Ex5 isoform [Salpingoeca rosetta]EGD78393.1 MSH2-Ex5 isoform [Salpingoeca rosetta]|eukprot:XP_004989716.1 MSH2-Ex5 isoform [Salpingoeca rosetta]
MSADGDMQKQGFCRFFQSLPEKPATTIRFFDRNDYYTLHGDDALFMAKTVFKTMGVVKHWGPQKLPSVNMSHMVFENTVKDLLLIKNYRVQVYSTKGNKSGKWELVKKASPGNTQMFEDILYAGGVNSSSIVMAVKLATEGQERVVGLAFCDVTANELRVCEFVDNDQFSNLEALVVQVGARECLITSDKSNPALAKVAQVVERCNVMVTQRKRSEFQHKDIEQDLGRLLKLEDDQTVSTLPQIDKKHAMDCVNAVIKYLELLSNDENFNRFFLLEFNFKQYMRLDAAAVRALSMFPTMGDGGQKSQSLFGLLNRCKTAQGQRLLQQWLKQPLLDVAKIAERHNVVDILTHDDEMRTGLIDVLRRFPDLNRLSKKFMRKKAQLQDCVQAYDAVLKIPKLTALLSEYHGEHAPLLKALFLDDLADLAVDFAKYKELIEKTIDLAEVDNHQYLIKPSFNEDMQSARDRMDELQGQLPAVLSKASADLGLDAQKTVKLERDSKTNQFHFRVSRTHEKKLRGSRQYEILETLKNGVKFVNKRLKTINEEYVGCYEQYLRIQEEVARKVVEVASGYATPMDDLNCVSAHLDVYVSFAVAGIEAPIPYVKPTMTPMGEGDLVLRGCRHPCVEVQDDVNFIANDVRMNRKTAELQIITGPNMGGKSTYIRQIGIAVLLAQIGCFVPAQEASICVCDSVLARVGAGDSQLKGISTFMAEMLETASILKSATANSLVIIDELGRGTSTYDGFGLAWAISEHVAKHIHCFCLFATHFHELTAMSSELPNVTNLHVDAMTSNGALTLLYKIKPGVCDRSFGIHVAELADFPEQVVQMAKDKAAELEEFAQDGNDDEEANDEGEGQETPTKRAKLSANEKERALLSFVKHAAQIDLERDPVAVLNDLRALRKDVPA